jgi:hypothetical protein
MRTSELATDRDDRRAQPLWLQTASLAPDPLLTSPDDGEGRRVAWGSSAMEHGHVSNNISHNALATQTLAAIAAAGETGEMRTGTKISLGNIEIR